MPSNEELRRTFDDDLEELEERADLSRECPACGCDGINSPADYKKDFLECVENDCPVWFFDVYGGEANAQ